MTYLPTGKHKFWLYTILPSHNSTEWELTRSIDIIHVIVNCNVTYSTSGQSNLAKAASNPRGKSGLPCNIQCFLGPKSLHPEQDLDPFSRICTAKPRKVVWQTDWQTPGIIDRNSPHFMHSMRPQIIYSSFEKNGSGDTTDLCSTFMSVCLA